MVDALARFDSMSIHPVCAQGLTRCPCRVDKDTHRDRNEHVFFLLYLEASEMGTKGLCEC